jgi:hypothetical protein
MQVGLLNTIVLQMVVDWQLEQGSGLNFFYYIKYSAL